MLIRGLAIFVSLQGSEGAADRVAETCRLAVVLDGFDGLL
jgi:hypothetical protein